MKTDGSDMHAVIGVARLEKPCLETSPRLRARHKAVAEASGWHHHIAMSLLAMLAVLMMQIELKVKADMLTLQDVKEILEVIMPRREIGEREILKMIKAKHKARISAREFHHRRQTAASAG